MNPRFLRLVADFRPTIKTCWEVLLRAEPPLSPLGNPDTLVYLMDCTLTEVFAFALTPEPRRWLARRPLLCAPLAETCPCGRNPLLQYYETGEQAVLSVAGRVATEFPGFKPGERAENLAELQLTFDYLAQRELQNFCDLCRCDCARSAVGYARASRRLPGPAPVPPLRGPKRRRVRRSLRRRPAPQAAAVR